MNCFWDIKSFIKLSDSKESVLPIILCKSINCKKNNLDRKKSAGFMQDVNDIIKKTDFQNKDLNSRGINEL